MITEKIILFLLAFFSFLIIYSREIKVMVIGNSFSEDAIESHLYQICLNNGGILLIGNLVIGGDHDSNAIQNTPAYSYRKAVNGEKKLTLKSLRRKVSKMRNGTMSAYSRYAIIQDFTIPSSHICLKTPQTPVCKSSYT